LYADDVDTFSDLRGIDYVLWGTGRVAQAFYQKYCVAQKCLQDPLFWCDNAAHKQGTEMDGIPVQSSEKVFELSRVCYLKGRPLAIVIGATGINLLQIVSQLEQQAVRAKICSAVQLDAAHYFTEHRRDIGEISTMFADEKSRQLYRRLIDNMMCGRPVDFSLAETDQYFSNDVIPSLDDDEVLVDAGVCGGEEIDKALAMNPRIRVHAFEPDAQSCGLLREKYSDCPQVVLYPYALWNEEAQLMFSGNQATPSASRLETGADAQGDVIRAMPLDAVLTEPPTLIKMDIEGAEYNALLGAEQMIREHHPKLAVCVYHSIEDYIRIPLLIRSFYSGYRFYFRHHSVTSGESVLYAL